MIDVLDVDRASAQTAGEVLRDSGGSDVIDALLALATRPGDQEEQAVGAVGDVRARHEQLGGCWAPGRSFWVVDTDITRWSEGWALDGGVGVSSLIPPLAPTVQ